MRPSWISVSERSMSAVMSGSLMLCGQIWMSERPVGVESRERPFLARYPRFRSVEMMVARVATVPRPSVFLRMSLSSPEDPLR